MVQRVINLMVKEVRGLHQAAYLLAIFAFASQLLAIVRDRLLAHTFGAGAELDIYYAAFRVPDLLFVLFASALSVYVLLPFVAKATETDGANKGSAVLSQMFTLFLLGYAALAAALAFLAPWYTPYLYPGLPPDTIATVTLLSQVLLLQPFFLGISSLLGVVTQMNNRFILYAISPLLYNLGIILGIIVLYPVLGLTGLVLGVVVGAVGHALVQVPYVQKSTHRFGLTSVFSWPLIRSICFVAVPRAFTLSVNQVVLLVFTSLATFMAAGSVAIFQFGYNLHSVPIAIIGMSYSVAAFPTLTSLFAKQDRTGFNTQLITAFRHIIFWSVPIIALVIVLRAQIVRVLLGSGAFDWADTRLTAAVLAVFMFSLVAQAILLLLIRAFYACGRTFTPLFIALISGSLSIVMGWWLLQWYETATEVTAWLQATLRITNLEGTEVVMLAVAFVIGQIVQLGLMMIVSAKIFSLRYDGLLRLSIQSLVAGIGGAFAAYSTLVFVVGGINQETFIGILLQGFLAGVVGVLVVVVLYRLLGSVELNEIIRSFQSKIRKNTPVIPSSDNL